MGRLPTGHCRSTARRARPSGTPVIRPTRPPRRPAPTRARGAEGRAAGRPRWWPRRSRPRGGLVWLAWCFAPGVRLGFLQEASLPQSSAAVNGFSANASTAMTRRPTASSLCTLGGWRKSSDASPQVGQSLKAADGRRPCLGDKGVEPRVELISVSTRGVVFGKLLCFEAHLNCLRIGVTHREDGRLHFRDEGTDFLRERRCGMFRGGRLGKILAMGQAPVGAKVA